MQEYLNVLKRYGTFIGRSRRREYWMYTLFTTLFGLLLGVIDLYFFPTNFSDATGIGLLSGAYSLFTLVPSLAVTIQRLHDTGRSGWWGLLSLVPVVGTIAVLVFLCLDSTPGTNQWGPNPKTVIPSPPAA